MFVGEYLKKVRVKRKFTLYEISKELNISLGYLKAIENDEFSKTPGGVYLIGFIRTYADYLNLNSTEIVNEYKTQVSIFDTSKQIELPKPMGAFHFISFAQMVSLLIFISISITFYFMFIDKSNIQPEYAITSEVPEDLNSIIEAYEVEEALSKFNNNKQTIIKSNEYSEIDLLNDNTLTNNNNQLTAIASNPTDIDVEAMKNLISLKALSPTWIQLRNSENIIVYSKLMDKNDVYNYLLDDNLAITTGNAGNILVSIDNKVMGKLGKKGEVLDLITILPDYFSN